MSIDSGSTHNFINCKLDKLILFFIYPTPKFQVMIANGDTKNYLWKWHNIILTMGEYLLNIPMVVIKLVGSNVVLGVQWLQSLGKVALNFQEIFMRFSLEGK